MLVLDQHLAALFSILQAPEIGRYNMICINNEMIVPSVQYRGSRF